MELYLVEIPTDLIPLIHIAENMIVEGERLFKPVILALW
jgi:hypothetical protein